MEGAELQVISLRTESHFHFLFPLVACGRFSPLWAQRFELGVWGFEMDPGFLYAKYTLSFC